ncbi:MAG: metal ABC transporter ATP-binding protein [Symbiopectobacterium sp.]|uniref:metal ABC transporter ATP-binding protein n=1 Tax=Symbiopectobacterium sp. TaxID=2952789 RepID=UPI0039EA9F24
MITLHNLTFGYASSSPLGTLSGCFSAGSLTAIVGENGSGKSTLLKTLAGLIPPLAGSLTRDRSALPRIGYLPQLSEFDRQFPLSVLDLVLMGSLPQRGLFGDLNSVWRRNAQAALEAVAMAGFAARPISHLSGGQLQRVLFARLLLADTPVLLLDEPFTGVDEETTQALLTLIHHRHQQGCTVLAVLHDRAIVEHHFPLVLQLSTAGHRWGATHDIFTSTVPASRSDQARVRAVV